jgi:ATPase subunit of ABC transporter with duplicated ATPase domains
VAVIAAVELDDDVALRETASDAQRAHRGICTARDAAHHFDRGKALVNGFGEPHFELGRRTERQAACRSLLHGVYDFWICVSEDRRPPGTNVIDVFAPSYGDDPAPVRSFDEDWMPPDRAKCTHRAIYSSRKQSLRPSQNLIRFRMTHCPGSSAILAKQRYRSAVIRLDAVSKQHGRQILFMDASCAVFRGEKAGLVGPNGSGKSTIFRMIVREEAPDGGQVAIDRGTTIGYFSQDVGEMNGMSVVAATMDGAGPVSEVATRLRELEIKLADPEHASELDQLIEAFGETQARYEELGGYGLDAKAREILAGLGFAPEVMDSDVGTLSGGWKMRVALARILLMRPDALLLDEPTNHLDIESILWLEQFLKNYEGALILTSHDREFLNRIVSKIIEIEAGELRVFSGDYEFYLKQRALLDAQAESEFERQRAMLAKEEAFIARFKARASHAAQVQSRIKKLDKIERVEPPKQRKKLRFDFPDPPRSGEDVANLVDVHKAYGASEIYRSLNLLIRRRERWCVMGVNGAGKSTLLKLIAGKTQPDRGRISVGASVELGYFAQHAMDLLEPDTSVWQTLSGKFQNSSIGSLRTLAGVFGFSGDDIEKPCRVLSGGEKARLVLAQMLYHPPNFLVLDEPTNHLDMDTKEMLIEALGRYQGTMLFVSHDRHFLRTLSSRVLELSPSGVRSFGGGYAEYVDETGQEAPGVRV